MDLIGKTDPVCTLYYKESLTAKWKKSDKTETIQDSINPDFKKSFMLKFYFEKYQYIKLKVQDGMNMDNDKDSLGVVKTSLGEIMGSQN